MKELLKEIEHYSSTLYHKECDDEKIITLDNLHEILLRYEVVSKDLNTPYTTGNE